MPASSEQSKLSWWRVLSGLVGAPLAAGAVIVLPSGFYWPFKLSALRMAIDQWLVMSLFGVPLALATGLPLLVLFEFLGWRAFWHYALGGAAIGVVISFVLPFYGSSYSVIVSGLLAIATGSSAMVFWLYAIVDWPRYVRRLFKADT